MNKKEKEYLLQELSNNAFILGNNTRAGLENGNSFASTLGAYHALQGMYRDWETDRKSTRLNSSHSAKSRMPSSA